MKMLLIVALGLISMSCVSDTPDSPPLPPGWSPPAPKAQVIVPPAPAPSVYHVNSGYSGPTICPVNNLTNILVLIPAGAPQVAVPNVTQAPFAMLQASPNLAPGSWTTLAYFTNFLNGLILVDGQGTNQFRFYRLVPQ